MMESRATRSEWMCVIISTYFFCCAILNVFVCIRIYKQGLFRNTGTLLTFNLAAVDVLTTAMDFDKFLKSLQTGTWFLGDDFCTGQQTASSSFASVYFGSYMLLICVEIFNSERIETSELVRDKSSYIEVMAKLLSCVVYVLPLYWSKYTFTAACFNCLTDAPPSDIKDIGLFSCVMLLLLAVTSRLWYKVWVFFYRESYECKSSESKDEKSHCLVEDVEKAGATLERKASQQRSFWNILCMSFLVWLLIGVTAIFSEFITIPAFLKVLPTMVVSFSPICFMKSIPNSVEVEGLS